MSSDNFITQKGKSENDGIMEDSSSATAPQDQDDGEDSTKVIERNSLTFSLWKSLDSLQWHRLLDEENAFNLLL